MAAIAFTGLVSALGDAAAPGAAERDVLLAVSGGMLLLAVGAALAAAPLAEGWLREASAALTLGAGALSLDAADPSAATVVWLSAGIGIAASVAGTALWTAGGAATGAEGRSGGVWLRPALIVAMASAATSVSAAASTLPERDLLVPALLVAAVEAALLGALLDQIAFKVASPVLACAAWAVFASEALSGNPQWFTVPSGVTLLVVVGLVRARRRRLGQTVHTHTLAALDDVGMAFVVGSALAQTIVEDIAYGLLAVALGTMLCLWGVVTRVRRRALGGASAVTLAVLLIASVPLASLLQDPEVNTSRPMLWLSLAGAGLVAILAASFLEQGKRRMRHTMGRVGELTRDWE